MATAIVGNKAVKAHDSVGTIYSTDLSEFISRIKQVNGTLAEAITSGQVKLVDSAIYSCKNLGGSTTVELMEAADQKKVGLRNLNKRQLEANTYMCLTGVQILMHKSDSSVAIDDLATAKFEMISEAIANGELEIKQGDKIIFPRNSMEIFKNANGTDRKPYTGYYKLESPKMLVPLTDIIPTVWLPSGVAADLDKYGIKIVLHGVRTNG